MLELFSAVGDLVLHIAGLVIGLAWFAAIPLSRMDWWGDDAATESTSSEPAWMSNNETVLGGHTWVGSLEFRNDDYDD